MISEIESYRDQMHEMIDRQINDLILREFCGDLSEHLEDDTYAQSLLSPAKAFKGTKPTAIILPNREKVKVSTWQQAVSIILLDCDSDLARHMRLTEMRNRIAGNFRWLLSDKPKEMRSPLEISNGLYFEGKFDTEALLRNLTKKVLEPAGYDYSGIAVILRKPPKNDRSTE